MIVALVPVPTVACPPGVLVRVQFPVAGRALSNTLPVATEQVGCVSVPTTGAEGVIGCELITILADAGEAHPASFVTVYVIEPEAMPETVLLTPVPAIAPGLSVQFPAGKPFNTALPVETRQVGCVSVPMAGADGVTGCALMITSTVGNEVHPTEFVTVKLYVFVTKLDMVLLLPAPVIAPGLIVQLPAGKPLKAALPVATEQLGCVIVPMTGTAGVTGCALMVIFLNNEIHPEAFVTV